MLREAIVIAGGLATRLGDLSRETPKCLQVVDGVPFVDHLVWNLRRQGFSRIVFALGHLAEEVRSHLGDGSRFGIDVAYSIESEPLGTGGATVLAAQQVTADEFLVLNGDTLFDVNCRALVNLPAGALGAMALREVPDAGRYGSVLVRDGLVREFAEKSTRGAGLISGGVYALTRTALELLPAGASSLETDLFPRLAESGRLAALVSSGFFVDIGTPESLLGAQESVSAWRHKSAVFLDRDGVLNEDTSYVHAPEEFQWLHGAREAVRWINDRGYLAIVVTNQAGIGRGLYGEAEFEHLMSWVAEELASAGAYLDAVYHCPHHPTAALGEYLVTCECRKPAPGMLLEAVSDWGIDVAGSVLIGDKESDMQAASAAGVRAVLYAGGDVLEFVRAHVPPHGGGASA